MPPETKKILFVCTYRGGRSQVAQALMKRHGSESIESHHACFDSDTISQGFVDLLKGMGIEISQRSPSVFDPEIRKIAFDYVVCLCSSVGTEMCALFRGNIDKIFPNCPKRLYWDIKDFAACAQAPEGFETCVKSICDDMEREIIALAKESEAARNSPQT